MSRNENIQQKTAQPEKKPGRTGMVASAVIMVAMIAVTYYIVFKEYSPAAMLAAYMDANHWYLLLCALLMVGYMLFQGMTFAIPMKRLGIRLPFSNYIGFAFAGVYFSGITPSSTGGQPMQLYYMRRRGISTADASLVLLLTNIAYQVVVMLYGVVMLGLRYSFVSETAGPMKAMIIFGYAVSAILVAGLYVAMFSRTFAKKMVFWGIAVLSKLRIVRRKERALRSAEIQLEEYDKGAAAIRRDPRLFLRTLGVTFLQMTCYFLVPFFVYKAFGLSGGSVWDFLAVQAILFIAVAYLPMPGSVGASEHGFSVLFSLFFPSSLLTPAMLISRSISFYLMMVISGGAVFAMQMSGKRDPLKKRKRIPRKITDREMP